MAKNYVTEISYEDFIKLNLVGYMREWVKNPDNNYKNLVWVKKDLNKFVYEAKQDGCKTMVIAIHKHYEKAAKEMMSWDSDFYYYDKWLNHLGAATYIIGNDISKLYKGPKKWYIKEDYFEIPYDETQNIYFIHLNEEE